MDGESRKIGEKNAGTASCLLVTKSLFNAHTYKTIPLTKELIDRRIVKASKPLRSGASNRKTKIKGKKVL